jgi:hypothetical protein
LAVQKESEKEKIAAFTFLSLIHFKWPRLILYLFVGRGQFKMNEKEKYAEATASGL